MAGGDCIYAENALYCYVEKKDILKGVLSHMARKKSGGAGRGLGRAVFLFFWTLILILVLLLGLIYVMEKGPSQIFMCPPAASAQV